MATTRQLDLAVDILRGVQTTSSGWGVPTAYEADWTLEDFQGALEAAIDVLTNDVEVGAVIIVSVGLIPEAHTYATQAEADAAWREMVDKAARDVGGYDLLATDLDAFPDFPLEEEDPDGYAEALAEHKATLYGSGFVYDGDDLELRMQ